MKNKKIIILICIVVLVIVGLLILQINIKKTQNTNKNNITPVKETISGDVEIDYKEGIKLSTENEYIEFVISGNNKEDVIYDINIKQGEDNKNKTRIEDEQIKFTLMKKVNDREYITVVENKSYKNIKEYYRMYIDVMLKESNKTHTYRLYMKVDNLDNNYYANVEVKVNGNVVANYKAIG